MNRQRIRVRIRLAGLLLVTALIGVLPVIAPTQAQSGSGYSLSGST